MKTIDELDALHAAATAGEWESVTMSGGWWRVRSADAARLLAFDDGSACDEYDAQCTPATRDAIVALHNAWPSVSARLRAAEALVAVADDVSAKALVRLKAQQAEVERLDTENARLRAEVERLTGEVASLAALVNPQAARDAAYEALENRAALAILATGEDDTLVGAATNAMAMKELYKAMWRRDQGYTHLARQAMTDGLAECERLRGALLRIATGRFASVAEACDIAEDALGADVVAAWNAAENARAALGKP